MSALSVIGWLAILTFAIWSSLAALWLGWALSVWGGRHEKIIEIGLIAVAGAAWFFCFYLAPFTLAWSTS